MVAPQSIVISNVSYLPSYGGIENSIRYLAQELKSQYSQVVVFTGITKTTPRSRMEVIDGITIYRFYFKPFHSRLLNILCCPLFFVDLMIACIAIRWRFRPAVAISRNQFMSIFVTLLITANNRYLAPGFAIEQQKASNLAGRSSLFYRGLALAKRQFHMLSDRLCLALARKIFVFSANMREQARRTLAGSLSRLTIVKPGVDLGRFRPADSVDQRRQLRARFRVPDDKLVLLCLGRLVGAKGFHFAIKALTSLEPHYHLLIVGDGPLEEELKRLAVTQGVADRTTFYGSTLEVEQCYRLADVFLFTSTYEPLGQTLLEAAACGLPVISFPNGNDVINATDEVLGPYAFYANAVTADALAVAIRCTTTKLMASSERAWLCHDDQVNYVRGRYSWAALAAQLTQ